MFTFELAQLSGKAVFKLNRLVILAENDFIMSSYAHCGLSRA
jgi:hypothetical protein